MTQTTAERRATSEWGGPEVRRRFSLIWALPVVAVLIAAWLAYAAFEERGPTISITFKTAAGLEAGKTRIKHHDVELGVIDRVEPSADLSTVIVSARMNKRAAEHLRDGTKFWVVRPRISITSLSGLETIVSGAYIEMDPGTGKSARAFVGLEDPPIVRSDVPGTEFLLNAEHLGSIGPGSPVYYRGIDVGEVTGYRFAGAGADIVIHVFVRKPYDEIVNESTRFWNASGISLSTGASGFKVEVDSLEAILAGGIAFESPESVRQREPAKQATEFPLYQDRGAARDASYTRRGRAIIEFEGSVRGLEIGAPVELRGMRIGRVVDVNLIVDAARRSAKIPVLIEVDFDRVGIVNQPAGESGSGKLADRLVELGLRAQLRSASLITGQLLIAFDFFPDAPPAEMQQESGLPKFPSVPNPLESLTNSVNQVLDKIIKLPVGDLLAEIRGLVSAVQARVTAPEVTEALRALNTTLTSTDRLVGDIQAQASPLIAGLRRVSDSADAAVKRADVTIASMNAGYGRDSQARGELVDLLKQMQETAKSVRYLATYLEQHPEALVRGKAGNR